MSFINKHANAQIRQHRLQWKDDIWGINREPYQLLSTINIILY